MSAKWEKIEKNIGILEVEVEADEVSKALDRAFKKVVKTVTVPGFRKGKVPRKIFESRFGVESLYNDALDIILPTAYTQAVVEAEIQPVDRPEVDVVQFEAGKPLLFKAKVTVKPEVELGEYKNLEIEEKDFAVTDEDLQEEMQRIRASHAEIVPVEDGVVASGDTVIIDFKGFVDGEEFEGGEAENYQLEIGSGTFIPGFEDQLIGMKKDEEKEIGVTFPEEYHVKHLAGQPAKFQVKLHDIKRKNLPELDDEFAKDISDFETLAELEADTRKRLEEQAEHGKKHYIEDSVVELAVKHASVEIPNAMIEAEIDQEVVQFENRLKSQGIPLEMYLEFTGATKESLRSEFKDSAENRVRTSLVLEAIAKAESLEASDEEIQKQLEEIAKSANMEVERVRMILQSNDPSLSAIRQDIVMRKTIDFLVENRKVG
ncbi:trigger factor [Fodinisporobacter ferrooxydans]|uniref:Trigger factor n=1 Tax=Fodinisporobacter ferrooxydans TaxID=2901836 RepID=A0ABY4CI44_9BACL|nr:trigger factor [Alicyclobacillaceae bacterium MYW30-H2]